MWLFTRYGFFSTACAQAAAFTPDPNLISVRARRKEHLENLRKRFPALQDGEIQESSGHDYRYRLTVAKSAWVDVVADLAEEQTWSYFKDEAAAHLKAGESEYLRLLDEVGALTKRLQSGRGSLQR
jgi:hypothetical protein